MQLTAERSTLFEDENYLLELETIGDFNFIHCQVVEYNKSRYYEMLGIWELMLKYLKEEEVDIVYTICELDNLKLKKFMTKFGFSKLGTIVDKEIWCSLTAPLEE